MAAPFFVSDTGKRTHMANRLISFDEFLHDSFRYYRWKMSLERFASTVAGMK